jgi:hypothetical protein
VKIGQLGFVSIHGIHTRREVLLALAEANAELVRMNQSKYSDSEGQMMALKI